MQVKSSLVNGLSLQQMQTRRSKRGRDIRGEFYRDTTAIIHSSSFRRLKHKTQVFFAPSNDHICTRMEHVLHVASIATAICRGLRLDTELAWAIGMGHDLGHTPFGHVGEQILDMLMKKHGLGSFEHEINSLRIVDFLAEHGKGLNLTYAVRDGIATHNGEVFQRSIKIDPVVRHLDSNISQRDALPSTWEAAVVRFSDQIAYLGRDFEDACRLAIIDSDSLPDNVARTLGRRNGEIIDTLVNDIVDTSIAEQGVCLSEKVFEAVNEMKEFNYNNIYKSPLLQGYGKYFTRLLCLIVDYLKQLLESYGMDEDLYKEERNMLAVGFYHYLAEMKDSYENHDGNLDRLVFDYIAGMSDNFCLDCANEILKPEHLNDRIEQSLTGKWFDVR